SSSRLRTVLVSASHTRIRPFQSPLTTVRPSGEIATDITAASCASTTGPLITIEPVGLAEGAGVAEAAGPGVPWSPGTSVPAPGVVDGETVADATDGVAEGDGLPGRACGEPDPAGDTVPSSGIAAGL